MRSGKLCGLLLMSVALAGCERLHLGGASTRNQELQERLRAELQVARPSYVTADVEGKRLWNQAHQFYEARGYVPAWIDDGTPRAQMDDLLAAIKASGQEGLDPELYGFAALEARRKAAGKGFLSKQGFKADEAGALDAYLTYLYMKFASDLADGVSDLARADSAWKIQPEKFDPLAHLERAVTENRVAASLRDLAPTAPQYQALRKALADYRALEGRGGWPAVPQKLKIKPGQSDPGVTALAQRLAASGDLAGEVAAGSGPPYGPALQEGVKRFQRRHGLEDDGVVGAEVVAQMNVPIAARIQQIELNMERWRWLPRELGPQHILVNIPAYHLEVRDNGRVALAMRVVVGKQDSPTPIFDDRMTYLVFSPYWNVPPDIARDETLPAMMKDDAFLQRTNMEIVDRAGTVVDPSKVDLSETTKYRFRQRPGGSNSLGLVKFMFPNQFNVYLHDTPADSLFERAGRSLSHGCVRVEQPEKLAAYVLRDQSDWTTERITEAMHGEEERTVKLTKPLPVYLGYWTASVGDDGAVHFTKDIYGIDRRQQEVVEERQARMRKSVVAAPLPGVGTSQPSRAQLAPKAKKS